MGIVNLRATYHLKVKEFRVTQIKARIDTLEQAAVLRAPETSSSPKGSDEANLDIDRQSQISKAMAGIQKGLLYRISETEKQYTKYKWLLNSEHHSSLETLLKECNRLYSKFLANTLIPGYDFNLLKSEFSASLQKADELVEAYEKARISEIERLYRTLNKELEI